MVDVKELKAQLKRADTTQAELARVVDMDPSTLNRKINNEEGENLTVKEAFAIAEALKIPRNMLTEIFFCFETYGNASFGIEGSAGNEKNNNRQ